MSAPAFSQRAYYLETSLWGMLGRGQPRHLQRDTQRLLRMFEPAHARTIISRVVLEELEPAEITDRQTMLDAIQRLKPMTAEISEPVDDLADRYIAAGIVTPKKRDDVFHVAAATLANADVVVSWNYRHLVRPRKAEEFCAINLISGYNSQLEISSPAELLYGERTNP